MVKNCSNMHESNADDDELAKSYAMMSAVAEELLLIWSATQLVINSRELHNADAVGAASGFLAAKFKEAMPQ